MFNPTKEVPSLELCRKLKKVGYPQDGGGWYWVDTIVKGWEVRFFPQTPSNTGPLNIDCIKAPTIAEMWEWLPFIINGGEDIDDFRERYGFLSVQKCDNGLSIVSWLNMYNKYHSRIPQFFGASLGNNMAEALIWLAENGYVRFEDD